MKTKQSILLLIASVLLIHLNNVNAQINKDMSIPEHNTHNKHTQKPTFYSPQNDDSVNYYTTFEGEFGDYSFIEFDLPENNIWQVGTPSKTMLNTSYSGSKALMTDTLNQVSSTINYLPMLGDTNVWTYSAWPWDFVDIVTTKDSIYKKQNYKSILHDNWFNNGWHSVGLLREDTSKQQVWYIEPGDTLERIIYDFSLNEGDSIWLQYNEDAPGQMLEKGWYFVDSIRIISFFETERRVFYLDNPLNIDLENLGSNRPYITWIEGVGSNLHPTYFLIKDCAADIGGISFIYGASIICAFKNNLHVYQDSALFPPYIYGWSCYKSATSVRQVLTERFSVYPNPVVSKINIDLKENNTTVTNIHLYNSAGNLLHKAKTHNNYYSIDIGDFVSGIYILTIIQDNYIQKEKLIITK